ncbi:MAG: acyltransferase [Bacteroidota bacterium]
MANPKLKHIIQIDGLRFFAVFGVIISHYVLDHVNNDIIRKIPFGTGVNLFFVISGYLITTILFNKKQAVENGLSTYTIEIKNFFAKRILRIFPLYYIVILSLFIFNYHEIESYYMYLVTFTTNIYMTFHNTYIGSKTHLWSLAVEEQFYIIWPFIIFFMKRKHFLNIFLILLFISLGSKFYFLNYTEWQIGANAFLSSCFDALSLGALLAYLQLYHIVVLEKILSKIALVFLILLYVALFIFPDLLPQTWKSFLGNFFTSIIYFYIVGLASQNKFRGIVKYSLENKVVLYLGKISYGIYIIHNFMPEMFYSFFAKKLPPTDEYGIKVIYWISLTILLASISWYVIERPALKLKKYFN